MQRFSAGELADLLARNGFVAADEEAAELLQAAGGDGARLEAMVARRMTGEPLAWITGWVDFCGVRVRVSPGVYVPRWFTETLAERALARLPAGGCAIDLCTGCGALAVVLAGAGASRVVASDLSEAAVACARSNGVEAYAGDLFAPLPPRLVADVITGVVPYVPTPDLGLLQRDTFTFEPSLFYDGGLDGLDVMRRAVAEAPSWLRPGGALLLELGGQQASALDLPGFADVRVLRDEEGDIRGIEGTVAS